MSCGSVVEALEPTAVSFAGGLLKPGPRQVADAPAALTLLAINPRGAPSSECWVEPAGSSYQVDPTESGVVGLDYSVQWIVRQGVKGPAYNGC